MLPFMIPNFQSNLRIPCIISDTIPALGKAPTKPEGVSVTSATGIEITKNDNIGFLSPFWSRMHLLILKPTAVEKGF